MKIPSAVFVDKPGTFLGKTSRRVVVRTQAGDRREYPLLRLKEITVEGKGISFSTDLLYQAVKLGVRISFVDRFGRHYVRIYPPHSTETIETARAQRKEYAREKRFELGKAIILQKITSQINFIKLFLNKNKEALLPERNQKIEECVSTIEKIKHQLEGEIISKETGGGTPVFF